MNPIPTPTPYAYEAVEYITLNASDWSIWNFADDAINVWNYEPLLGQLVQTALVIVLVIIFVVVLIRQLQKLQGDE
jgi:hypothetical protein